MIGIRDLSYRYPGSSTPSLVVPQLDLPAGEVTLVVGPSGSGKSTLLRLSNGLVPHFHGGTLGGEVRVAGRDPVALGPRGMSGTVGFVFQDPEAQFVAERAEDELAFAMENAGLPRAEMRRRMTRVVALLDLTRLSRRRLATLSGGERQRLAIASVLAAEPRVLVLDEPTSQLDPVAAEEVLAAVDRLHRELGLTVVLAEHRIERVAGFARYAVELPDRGRPPRQGAARSVLADSEAAPPVAVLGRGLGWRPVPLTLEEARPFARRLELPRPPARPSSPRGLPPTLSARGLRFSYDGGEPVLASVDLDVAPGEILALLGRNGAGKSTLLKCLVGLLRPAAGGVSVGGRDTARLPLHRVARRVGFVPQNPARLLFRDRVADEVRWSRRMHGLPEDPGDLLDRLGLSALAEADPRDLSTGERQRVALAAVLAVDPPVLLLDEPTRGLDGGAKASLGRLLEELARRGTAVVVATHDVELVARSAHRAVALAGGRLVADGAVGEVMAALPAFASQTFRLFGDPARLVPEDVLPTGESR